MRIQKYLPSLDICLIILFAFTFSFWLMFHTFSYDSQTHSMLVAYKLWSDFGAHIPMIRSFSMSDNLSRFIHGTVQYPIFPGEPIRYHYFFFMIVGILEKIGFRIDWALNIPSALGFASVIILLYLISKRLFHSIGVGILTVVFFLFNGSLAFLRFLMIHPLSTTTMQDIIRNNTFPAFAPWGPGFVTAFWNLNIYTNQRHLAPAFAIVLLFINTVTRDKQLSPKQQILTAIPWGIVFGVFPIFHPPSLLIVAICMICYFFLYPRSQLFLFTVGVITLSIVVPQFAHIQSETKLSEWYPGYIVHNELMALPTVWNMIWHMMLFWWQNLGLHSILICIGFFFIPKNARRAIIPIVLIFIIPNLFKFSVEASANHKFFNFVMMLGSMISAFVLVSIFHKVWKRKNVLFTALISCVLLCITLFLTLSGIIDFFVVFNDAKGRVSDVPANETATWIAGNTPPDAIFLNSSYLYHPASIAGRAIFLGWPYFAWSAGYKQNRAPDMNTMYESHDPIQMCPVFATYHITYMTVEDVINDPNLPHIDLSYFLRTYTPVFLTSNKRLAIIATKDICGK
jgi:hypothetical protein